MGPRFTIKGQEWDKAEFVTSYAMSEGTVEFAEQLGCSRIHLSVVLTALRKEGYDIPRLDKYEEQTRRCNKRRRALGYEELPMPRPYQTANQKKENN